MDEITRSVTTIAVAIVGIALLAVLVSKNANTAGVLQAGGSSFATALSAAEGPVTNSGTGGFGIPQITGLTGDMTLNG